MDIAIRGMVHPRRPGSFPRGSWTGHQNLADAAKKGLYGEMQK